MDYQYKVCAVPIFFLTLRITENLLVMKRLMLIGLLFCVLPTWAQPRFEVDKKAPNLKIEMLDGEPVKLSGCRGRVVLLSFWATWCKPCLKELNEVPDKILKRFEGEKFTMIALAKGEPRVTVEKKMAELAAAGVVFPVGLDPYERISRLLGDDRIPQLVVIGPDGVVRYHEVGYTPERLDEVAALIEKLLPR